MSKQVPNTAETPLPPAHPAAGALGPLVGRKFGRYEVSSYIGEGPTGQVYHAKDLMGAKVAIKVMHRELSHKQHAQQLWDELKRLAATGDEHFVRVYDCGYGDDDEFYFLMDDLTGVDLEVALEESGAFAPRRAVEIVDGVAAALERAHTEGVVHGGLKPRNVFLSPTGGKLTIKVLDFGAAHLAGGVDKGVIVGNPFYMAPEQFGGVADVRTDVYSLGVIMYELFSGTLAVQRTDARSGDDAAPGRAAAAAAGRRRATVQHHSQIARQSASGATSIDRGIARCAPQVGGGCSHPGGCGDVASDRAGGRGPKPQAWGTHDAGCSRARVEARRTMP